MEKRLKGVSNANPEQNLDWLQWLDRWERMQNAYLPHRATRFELMFRLPSFAPESQLKILDLGCGPGSLSFTALQYFPRACVLAVDTDPVLLAIGRAVGTQQYDGKVDFLNADLRNSSWWESFAETFDLVVSATALHWLNPDHLAEVYTRIYRVLKPCGWFFNADHIASDDPNTQKRYIQLLSEWQVRSFQNPKTEDWETYWQALHNTLNAYGISFTPPVIDSWEGDDDGLPQSYHIELLHDLGFENINIHWQYLGEALLGAQKPAWSKRKLLNAYAKVNTEKRSHIINES